MTNIFSRSKIGSFFLAFLVALLVPRAIYESVKPFISNTIVQETKSDQTPNQVEVSTEKTYSDAFLGLIFLISLLCFMLGTIKSIYPLNYGFLAAGFLNFIVNYKYLAQSYSVLFKPHFFSLIIILIMLIYSSYSFDNNTDE